MNNKLLIVLGLYVIIFFLSGRKNIKLYLIFISFLSLGMSIDYQLVEGFASTWTDGIFITFSDVTLIILYIYITIYSPPGNASKKKKVKRSWLEFFALAFIVCCILSAMDAETKKMSLFAIIELTKILVLYYFLIKKLELTHKELKNICFFLVISLGFQGICGFIQYMFEVNTIINTGKEMGLIRLFDSGKIRTSGTFGRPNGYAFMMASLMSFTLPLLASKNFFHHKKFCLILFLFGISGLLFSFSRGGWLSFGFSFLIFILFSIKMGLLEKKVLKWFFIVATIVIVLFYNNLENRISGDDHKSASTRIELARIALNIIKENPINGVGINNYYQHVGDYIPLDYHGTYIHVVHNEFLLIFSEVGILGFLTFSGIFISALVMTWKTIQQNNNDIRMISLGLFLAILTIIFHMNVEYVTNRNMLSIIFFIFGLVESVYRLKINATLKERKPA